MASDIIRNAGEPDIHLIVISAQLEGSGQLRATGSIHERLNHVIVVIIVTQEEVPGLTAGNIHVHGIANALLAGALIDAEENNVIIEFHT